MHFSGQGHVWLELVDAGGRPVPQEEGVVGEAVYTTLTREAMPIVRFRSGDLLEVLGTSCDCGRSGVRVRITGRTDDMFTVRGVNVYPSAVQDVVASFQPAVTGRVRLVLGGPPGSPVEPPVPLEVEIVDEASVPASLAEEIGRAVRERLVFTPTVHLVPAASFAAPGYKTPLVDRR
jgi:phenylacetate-CoA ligase